VKFEGSLVLTTFHNTRSLKTISDCSQPGGNQHCVNPEKGTKNESVRASSFLQASSRRSRDRQYYGTKLCAQNRTTKRKTRIFSFPNSPKSRGNPKLLLNCYQLTHQRLHKGFSTIPHRHFSRTWHCVHCRIAVLLRNLPNPPLFPRPARLAQSNQSQIIPQIHQIANTSLIAASRPAGNRLIGRAFHHY